jgi:hypothetical protein
VIYILATRQFLSQTLQIILGALRGYLKLETVRQESLFLKGVEATVNYEEPDFFVVEIVILLDGRRFIHVFVLCALASSIGTFLSFQALRADV